MEKTIETNMFKKLESDRFTLGARGVGDKSELGGKISFRRFIFVDKKL
jgi:hypothetical protein